MTVITIRFRVSTSAVLYGGVAGELCPEAIRPKGHSLLATRNERWGVGRFRIPFLYTLTHERFWSFELLFSM
ncbi:hypothetical protein B0J11DRAFT_527592, partial [Dendryphion nanum]